MSNLISKFGGICWTFLFLFGLFFVFASLIPEWAILYVATVLGLFILGSVGYNLYQIHLREGLDLGWFLAVKKGYWRILLGLFGLILFGFGLFAIIFPRNASEFADKHFMKVAYFLAILFWIALTSTVLSITLPFFAETLTLLKSRKFKSAISAFIAGAFFLLLSTIFLSLFIDMVNENFLRISETIHNWILLVFVIAAIIFGFCLERFENSSDLKESK